MLPSNVWSHLWVKGVVSLASLCSPATLSYPRAHFSKLKRAHMLHLSLLNYVYLGMLSSYVFEKSLFFFFFPIISLAVLKCCCPYSSSVGVGGIVRSPSQRQFCSRIFWLGKIRWRPLASSDDEGEPHGCMGLSHDLDLGSWPRVFSVIESQKGASVYFFGKLRGREQGSLTPWH